MVRTKIEILALVYKFLLSLSPDFAKQAKEFKSIFNPIQVKGADLNEIVEHYKKSFRTKYQFSFVPKVDDSGTSDSDRSKCEFDSSEEEKASVITKPDSKSASESLKGGKSGNVIPKPVSETMAKEKPSSEDSYSSEYSDGSEDRDSSEEGDSSEGEKHKVAVTKPSATAVKDSKKKSSPQNSDSDSSGVVKTNTKLTISLVTKPDSSSSDCDSTVKKGESSSSEESDSEEEKRKPVIKQPSTINDVEKPSSVGESEDTAPKPPAKIYEKMKPVVKSTISLNSSRNEGSDSDLDSEKNQQIRKPVKLIIKEATNKESSSDDSRDSYSEEEEKTKHTTPQVKPTQKRADSSSVCISDSDHENVKQNLEAKSIQVALGMARKRKAESSSNHSDCIDFHDKTSPSKKINFTTSKPPQTRKAAAEESSSESSGDYSEDGEVEKVRYNVVPVKKKKRHLIMLWPKRWSEMQCKSEMLSEQIEARLLATDDTGWDLEVAMFLEKGRDLVATRDMKKGPFVVEYAGDRLDGTFAKDREQKYSLDDK